MEQSVIPMDGVYGELIRDLGRDCGSQMACGMFVSPIQAGVVAEESRPSNSYCLGYSVHIVDWRNDSLPSSPFASSTFGNMSMRAAKSFRETLRIMSLEFSTTMLPYMNGLSAQCYEELIHQRQSPKRYRLLAVLWNRWLSFIIDWQYLVISEN